jgi:hypothetical protein
MSIGEDIKKLAGKRNRSGDWYTNELMNRLSPIQKFDINEIDTGGISVGNLYFFMYSAQNAGKLEYWDRQPLVFVTEIGKGYFLGCNLHYINKDYRDGIARSLINKRDTINVPRHSIKRYFFSGVMSSFMKVPKEDWVSISLLPTEKFVDNTGSSFPKHKAWSKH